MPIRTLVLLSFAAAAVAFPAEPNHWVVTWGASPSPQLAGEQEMQAANLVFQNETLREIVHTSIGGDTFRVRLSNTFGSNEVAIAAAHLALSSGGSAINAGTDRALTFSGQSSVTIPANAIVLSDPINLKIPPASDVSVSLFLPESALGAGIHYASQQTSFVGSGNQTAAASLSNEKKTTSWVFLSGIDASASSATETLVAFGDSITDGAKSTVDSNHRWPDLLSGRLLAAHEPVGILNAGIGGNRVLHDAKGNVAFGVSALARFDRDVLAQPDVRYLIVLEGINDLGHPGTSAPVSETVSAGEIIAGLKQLTARAHEHGIKVFGATLTPFEGTVYPGYFSPERELKRKAVNEWIRSSKDLDGVIDFDKAIRDPQHPDRMLPAFDGGDHLHPSDAGYNAMAQAIDLSSFR